MRYEIPEDLQLRFRKIAVLTNTKDENITKMRTRRVIKLCDEIAKRTSEAFKAVAKIYPHAKLQNAIAKSEDTGYVVYSDEQQA